MEAIERRPLRATEVLDGAVKLVTSRIGELARAILAVAVPVQVLNLLYFLSLDEAFFETPTGTGRVDLLLSLGGVLGLAAGVAEYAVAVRIVAWAYLGERPRWSEALRVALRRLPAILLAVILLGLAVTAGVIALLVPGIFLAIALSTSIPALLVEGLSATRSLRRSFRLVRGRWWATFGALVLAGIIVLVLNLVTTAVVAAVFLRGTQSLSTWRLATAVSSLVSLAVGVLTTSLLAAVGTVSYFDLRVRKEGLDVELLAREPASEPPLTPQPGAGPEPEDRESS